MLTAVGVSDELDEARRQQLEVVLAGRDVGLWARSMESAWAHSCLEQLPGEQREVLVLRHIVGLSPLEIAEALGKTESSIHGLHHRGRQRLRVALEDLGAAPVVAST
jgi:RNA polymerase sigma factor (sigma-70 family)